MEQGPSENDLSDLVRRAQGGDDDARNALFEHYLEPVLRQVRNRMSVPLRRRMESIDLVQTGMREALQGIGRFEWQGPGSFYRWLVTIVDHKIRQKARHWKTKKRSAHGEIPIARGGDGSGEIPVPSPDPGPASSASDSERRTLLRSRLEELDETSRTILELSMEGLSDSAIGERTGQSRDMVLRARVAAIRRLAFKLKGLEEERPEDE
jgi:RNA polymerase sigma factor (sigma-70 family)